jgi:hypothetical protein
MNPIASDSTAYTAGQPPDTLWWPHFNDTYSIIALALSVAIFFIAYFAGGKLNRTKIFFSFLTATLLGFFSMPFFIGVFDRFGLLNSRLGVVGLYCGVMVFVAALSVNIYEIIVVTAREALPPR